MNYEMLRDIVGARRNSFAFVTFLLLLNAALILYLSMWQRPELAKAQTDWFAKRQAQAGGQSPASVTRYQQGTSELELFRARLIPKKEFAAFLNRLFESAKNNSLKLQGIAYRPGAIKEEGIVTYGITFTVTGRYASAKSFISDLGRLPELVTLDTVRLNSKSQTEESVNLQVEMTAYLKEGA